MKAEERKELETNTLVTLLEKGAEGLKKGPPKTTYYIIGGILVVVVLFFVWQYFSRQAWDRDAERWLSWQNVATPQEINRLVDEARKANPQEWGMMGPEDQRLMGQLLCLDKFIKDNEGSGQARLARYQRSRLKLGWALQNLAPLHTRDKSRKFLQEAGDEYDKLIGEGAVPVLQQEAMLNAGKAREALGERDKARDYYQRLAPEYPKKSPESEIGKLAVAALERLDNEANKRDLELLAKEFKEAPPSQAPPIPGPAPVPPMP